MDPNISTQPTQPVQAEIPAQQPLPPKKSNKKIIFWIFAILLFLIAFVAGGFFTGAKQNKSASQNQQKTVAPTPLSSEASAKVDDPTVNWKTYTNTQNLYSFRYPDTLFTIQENGSRTRLLEGMGYTFEVNAIQTTDTVENWLIKEKNDGQFPDNNWKSVQSNFQSYPALLLQSLPNTMQVAMDVFVVKNKNLIYEISFSKETSDKTIVDQILSTFKFTDQNQTYSTVKNLKPISQTIPSGLEDELFTAYTQDLAKLGKMPIFPATCRDCFSISEYYGDVATGEVSSHPPGTPGGGGAVWTMNKNNGNWVIIDAGSVEEPYCKDLKAIINELRPWQEIGACYASDGKQLINITDPSQLQNNNY